MHFPQDVKQISEVNSAVSIHTVFSQEIHIFLAIIILPYVFRHASPPTNIDRLKPFTHQNVQLFLGHYCFYFSHFYLLYFWKYSAFSAKFCPAASAFQLFQKFIFFQKFFNIESNGKSFKSSSKLINFQPHLVPHTLSETHHSNFKTVSRP